MRRTLRIVARIAGGLVGLVAAGMLGFYAACAVVAGTAKGDEDAALIGVILLGPVGFLVGTPVGAAIGATIVQRMLREKASFWKGLLGAVGGLVVGVLPTGLCLWTLYEQGVWHDGWWPFFVGIAVVCAIVIAGAVMGSGWKAEPTAKAQGRTRDQDVPMDLI
jgi:hypothetical protein